jgi:hypothetical protein
MSGAQDLGHSRPLFGVAVDDGDAHGSTGVVSGI